MRITVAIDDDVFERIRAEALRKQRSFRDVLNERLRLGFSADKAPGGSEMFTVKPFDTPGFGPGVNEKALGQLLDTLDTQDRKR